MDRKEALKLLRGGDEGIKEWNRRRKAGEEIPDLDGGIRRKAYIRELYVRASDLREANLTGADLSNVHLCGADLSGALLTWADLSEADLAGADLIEADLQKTNLGQADLQEANLICADLSLANLAQADLSGADLTNADLSGADLAAAHLTGADLSGADLTAADLSKAYMGWTAFGDANLSEAKGLDSVNHHGASTIGVDTLVRSKGRLPEKFLRGCGFTPWQVLEARMYDPNLTASEIVELQNKIFDLRTTGAIFFGGVFLSYSWEDAKFIDKMHDRLQEKGAPVWVDRHDAVAGPIKKQVREAIRLNDVVLLVLSKHSIDSDWVAHELKAARRRERKEKRDILCPVALDDTWQAKCKHDPDWGHLTDKLILDFSKWKTKAFEQQFQKLLKGLKVYYPLKGKGDPPDVAPT